MSAKFIQWEIKKKSDNSKNNPDTIVHALNGVSESITKGEFTAIAWTPVKSLDISLEGMVNIINPQKLSTVQAGIKYKY
ncbi:MAG: hypothetical protein SOZ24_03405 [Treponema sp.]|nr:hypothetical protein [Treponema sp.]